MKDRLDERQRVTRFDASELRGSDFAGVKVPGGKLEASVRRGSDFSHADLTGSSFRASDVADAIFDGANFLDRCGHVADRAGTGLLPRLHPSAHRLQQVGADLSHVTVE